MSNEPLERVLEPEVMDTPQEARDYDGMDHSEVNRIFVDNLMASGFQGNDILDLGTGTALIPIELCKRLDDCRVMAVDAAVHMLDIAKFNIDVAGMLQRIQLQKVDAKDMDFPDNMFDAVVSNSIIHHIPEPLLVLKEAIRVTRPGGTLFFRDLLRPQCEASLGQLVQTYTGDENQHSQQMFADSLHAALSLSEIQGLVSSLGFNSEGVVQNTDRHWTWTATKPAAS